MAKYVIITFTSDGAIVQNQCSAVGIRQGDGAGEVTFKAAFTGRRNDEYVAKLHFKRPDGKTVQNVVMSPSSTDPNAFVATANTSWYFAVPGTAKATITITSTGGTIAAQGSYSFNVEATEVEVADSTLNYDEAAALEGLIADLDDRTLKRGTVLTLSSQATAEDFYDAILAYYSENEIDPKDGDRFVAQSMHLFVGSTKPVLFSGEYRNTKDVFIVENTPTGSAGTTNTSNIYVGFKSGSTPTVIKIATKSYVDSFFDENGAAYKAVADEDGNRLEETYVKLAGFNTVSATTLFTGTVSFNRAGTVSFGGTTSFNSVINVAAGLHANGKSNIKIAIGPTAGYVSEYVFPYSGNESGRNTTYTLATTEHISDAIDYLKTYANNWTGTNTFKSYVNVQQGLYLQDTTLFFWGSESHIRAGEGTFAYYYLPYYADGNAYTIATTSQVATAKADAISSAASTAQSKVDALAEAMDFSNGEFGEIKAEKITVREFVSETTYSTSSAIESHYFEFMKGNATDLSANYAGSAFTKYDGDKDFFYGLYGHEFVFGKCDVERDEDGNIINIDPVSLISAMGRAPTSALVNDHILKWDAATKKAVDGGFAASEVMSVLDQESQRVINENGRVAAENIRAAVEVTREKIQPFPMTTAEYNHIKNDGWRYNVFADGTYSVTENEAQNAVRYYLYQQNALYELTDDTAMAQALETVSQASDLINSIDFVTAEQWAALYAQDALVTGTHYILDDENHMKKLCVDIPAAEAERQAFETYRIEHEGYGITRAQLATLNANGVFGVHFATVNGKLTTVVSVYASQALAEAADEEYIFPMQQGVTYALLD